VELEGRVIEFQLDDENSHWVPVEPIDSARFEEADFPLIASADGLRYELYSDGTFGQVEL
jgi:hypothetical protein